MWRFDAFCESVFRVTRKLIVRPVAELLPFWVTPHLLSGLRLCGAAVVGVSLFRGAVGVAAVAYGAALATDALDGELARFRGRATQFGARLDPVVDKVLHGAVFLSFWPRAPILISLLLLLDLLLLTAGALLLLSARRESVDFSASVLGRVKVTFQACAGGVLFWDALFPPVAFPSFVAQALLGGAVLFAVWAEGQYLRRLRR